MERETQDKAKKAVYLKDMQALSPTGTDAGGTIKSYLAKQQQENRIRQRELAEQQRFQKELAQKRAELIRLYQKEGRAAFIRFKVCTPLVVIKDESQFPAVLQGIKRELENIDHFEIHQKMMGTLQVNIEELKAPEIFSSEWAALTSPKQLAQLGTEEFARLQDELATHLCVAPVNDIQTADGRVYEAKKLLPAKAVEGILGRLPAVAPTKGKVEDLPQNGGYLGNVMEGANITDIPFLYPVYPHIIYISGKTRMGKSYVRVVLVENSLMGGVTAVIILDPTRQSCGLALPATDPAILERFDKLKIPRKAVRGFNARIYTPGSDVGLPMPRDIKELCTGCSVITMKDLHEHFEDADLERCQIARDVLRMLYETLNTETSVTKIMLVIEEAHVFLPSGVVSQQAKEVAKEVSTLLRRMARDKGKYGLQIIIVSQALSDFRGDSKIVRDMVTGRCFLQATDRAELDYV